MKKNNTSTHQSHKPDRFGKLARLTFGFTLMELLVSITIFGIMMMTVMELYMDATKTNKQLELIRILQSNARDVTEFIARDIREYGINFAAYPTGLNAISYQNGNYALYSGDKIYGNHNNAIPATKDEDCEHETPGGGGLLSAGEVCQIGYSDSAGDITTLTDTQVHIKNLKFFISGGDSIASSYEGKVTIVFDMQIADKAGIPSDIARNTSIHVQTTISEKIYKQ